MLAAGCGKPSAPPEQFIGTWISAPKGERLRLGAFPTLTLAPDGTGNYTQYPDPHVRGVSWVLRGDKLVLADRDGSGSVTYSYRFNSRDELVIVMEGGESVFKRYTESSLLRQSPGATELRGPGSRAPVAKASGPKGGSRDRPTRGASARQSARSRR